MRLLPWVHNARDKLAERDDAEANNYLECGYCQENIPPKARQMWGCGFLPRIKDWQPASLGSDTKQTVCPGYTTSLPEVVEVGKAHFWFSKGQLVDRYEGEKPTDQLISGIDILSGSVGNLERHLLAEIKKKS